MFHSMSNVKQRLQPDTDVVKRNNHVTALALHLHYTCFFLYKIPFKSLTKFSQQGCIELIQISSKGI